MNVQYRVELSQSKRNELTALLSGGKEEALLVATACSEPPEGRGRWTLELLSDRLVKLTENDLKPWRKDMWCIPQVDAAYVAAMEDVLDLYAEAPDARR